MTSPLGSWIATPMPVTFEPGLIRRNMSGVSGCSHLEASRTAKWPCRHSLMALPDSIHLLAREGLVGAMGVPSVLSTGTVFWLYGEVFLVNPLTPVWAVSPVDPGSWYDPPVWGCRPAGRHLAHAPGRILHPRGPGAFWANVPFGLESSRLVEHLKVRTFACLVRSLTCFNPLRQAMSCAMHLSSFVASMSWLLGYSLCKAAFHVYFSFVLVSLLWSVFRERVYGFPHSPSF